MSKILVLTAQNNCKCGEGNRQRSRLPSTTAAGRIVMSVFKDSLETVYILFYIRHMTAAM